MAKQTATKKVITVKTKGASPKTAKSSGKADGEKKSRSSSAGKAGAKEAAGGPRKELTALLDQLGSDEIHWLLKQVKTMLYNKKVVELNQAAKDLAETKSTAPKAAGRQKTPSEPSVDIVQAGGPKNFNIIMGSSHLFLNLGELKELVRIAQAADNAGDGAARLYRWCGRERSDMINDAGLSGPGDARLGLLYGILKERYSVG